MISGHSFDWDDAKAQSNLAKHGVPFAYAVRVFLDPRRLEFEVSKPEEGEVRHKVVGEIERRLFTVVYAPRGGVTRIISGRRSNSSEERRYGRLHS